jgi:hypothetical protein
VSGGVEKSVGGKGEEGVEEGEPPEFLPRWWTCKHGVCGCDALKFKERARRRSEWGQEMRK